MFRFLIVTVIFTTAYGSALSKLPQKPVDSMRNGRVMGGDAADIREAPHQVAMLAYWSKIDFTQVCGGSIISANVIVTSASCVISYGSNPVLWKIRAGSSFSMEGGQLIDVNRIIMHENYDFYTNDHDIALFFLSSEIYLDYVDTKNIELPLQGTDVADGTPAIITGWGSTTESMDTVSSLQIVTSHIANQHECIVAFSGMVSITARMICTGDFRTEGAAACFGDFGGPLVANNVLVGIYSFSQGCGRPQFPGVWTKVSAHRNWIDRYVLNL